MGERSRGMEKGKGGRITETRENNFTENEKGLIEEIERIEREEEEKYREIEAELEAVDGLLEEYGEPGKAVKAVYDNGKFRPAKKVNHHCYKISSAADIEEEPVKWLVPGLLPAAEIASLAGDGGTGKSTVSCVLAAQVSSGKQNKLFAWEQIQGCPYEGKGGNVLIFSAEDTAKRTLVRRLRKNGANLNNIYIMDLSDERLKDIDFTSEVLEEYIKEYRPLLTVFDPIQAFIPENIRMSERNAMRKCLEPLAALAEKYNTTILIVCHSNKMQGASGRTRIADSADIWDASRSVLMVGNCPTEKGLRYLSHEKSNYGPLQNTVLFESVNEVLEFKGYTEKRDREFMLDRHKGTREDKGSSPTEQAKEFILSTLLEFGGQIEVAELDGIAKAMGISKNALKNAKSELAKEKKIHNYKIGFKKNDIKFYIKTVKQEESVAENKGKSLTHSENINEYD